MAPAEKKPRAAKATTETKTTKTTTKAKKVAATKPKVAPAPKAKPAAVTGEQIAERAFYIWADGAGDDPFANWVRAERELTTT